MSDVKQVKIDNWGSYFLQRLKHFFNRTDYCDLILQFQDNAQLKVHRLVLSACTEYFELLERTCEMYEDCLIMPEDLQADVVVPIVNFMYTGQLEFKMSLLERLYQTSQIMNMPVLTKLLKTHRDEACSRPNETQQLVKQYERRLADKPKQTVSSHGSSKRSYSKAFNSSNANSHKIRPDVKKRDKITPFVDRHSSHFRNSKARLAEPRPTRYELPEELDDDNEFSNSFTNVSYASEPLMVHPESSKSYLAKKQKTYDTSKFGTTSTINLISSKQLSENDSIHQDDESESIDEESEIYGSAGNIKHEPTKDTSHLFDQILDDSPPMTENLPKVTIETKDNNQASNLDHAKIISEVLKKYPHLVKSNKNIKLKILDTQPKVKPHSENKKKIKSILKDFAFQSKVLDSKKAAKLIAMGAENVDGPWICLICGTPGKALHFKTYYSFRRHLVDVHNEKPVSTICEYCGLKSLKRNYLVYHLYTKHDVEPPKQYRFPKCNFCNYVALTDGLLAKHKMNHAEAKNFWCNHCASKFDSSNQLLVHIQNTGHKYTGDRKTNLQCIYCLKNFLRESNLFAHLKTNHKKAALDDGVIDPSDDEKDGMHTQYIKKSVNYEVPVSFENYGDSYTQYEIKQGNDGNIEILTKKSSPQKQNILNSKLKENVNKMNNDNQDSDEEMASVEPECYNPAKSHMKYEISDDKSEITKLHLFQPMQDANKVVSKSQSRPTTTDKYKKVQVATSSISTSSQSYPNKQNQRQDRISSESIQEEIVMIDNIEYIIRNNHLIPRSVPEEEFITPDLLSSESDEPMQVITTTRPIELELNNVIDEERLRKSDNINQPIQIVVSSEEEYKALIASNPILFDDGNSNKTLTVLTTPQHNPNIELDNTQTNDMMIIQDNFPINVSQSVSADNSNIVVVYSHSVDTQNKQQYQLIPQTMDTELDQSSAVITTNYETVTTSSSVVSAHVIETPLEHWQGNGQDNQQSQMSAELQPVNIIQQTVIVPSQHTLTDNTNVITDAQLSTEYTHDSEDSVNQNNTDNVPVEEISDNTDTAHVRLSTQEQIQNESSPLMDVDNVPLDKEMTVIQRVNIVEQNKKNDVDISLPEKANYESVVVEVVPESNDPSNKKIQSKIVENDNIVEESIENNTELAEITETQNKDVINPPAVDRQIQSLTSDWSEDEYDSSPNTQTKTNSEVKKATTDVEESIENIQQEVDQQMSEVNQQIEEVHQERTESVQQTGELNPQINVVAEKAESDQLITEVDEQTEGDQDTSEVDQLIADDKQQTALIDEPMPNVETEESAYSNEEICTESEPVYQTTEIIIGNNTPARDKISSLLNDWEENDSQESSQKSGDEEIADPDKVTAPLSNNDKLESDSTKANDTPKRDEKIKHLVSDWDDDDDEDGSKE